MDPRMHPEQHARAVVTAYREGERMPASARDAAWVRLSAAMREDKIGNGEVVEVVEVVGEVVVPRGAARSRWLAGGAALLAAAALVLVIDGQRRSAGREAEGAGDHQAVHELPAAAPEPVRTVRSPAGEVLLVMPPPAVAEPGPAREPPRSGTQPPEDATLGAELVLLREARAALARAAPEEALQRLAEHEQRFPGGLLAEERSVLRVRALCESGAAEQARAAARRFIQEHPNSPHAASLAGSCGE